MSFSHLGLSAKVLAAIESAGYKTPTPIQEQAIPHVLARRDVLGIAQTGTGKTAAFVLPMLTMLEQGRARARMPRTLILEPTRELAAQVVEHFEKYGKNHKLNVALIIGGVSFGDQDAKLTRGVDVLIATPGRLLDHSERGRLLLSGVELLVIDEADRMLDMGFIPDIERIGKLVPFTRQTLFFTATMPPEIQRIADNFLHNPVRVEVSKPATAATTITQLLVATGRDPADKRETLRRLIRSADGFKNAIVFCNRKREVAQLHRSLLRHKFNAVGAARRPRPVGAHRRARCLPQRRGQAADRLRRRRARPRYPGGQPHLQFRRAASPRRLRPPHRPHRPRRLERHRHHHRGADRQQGGRRDRAADRPDHPLDGRAGAAPRPARAGRREGERSHRGGRQRGQQPRAPTATPSGQATAGATPAATATAVSDTEPAARRSQPRAAAAARAARRGHPTAATCPPSCCARCRSRPDNGPFSEPDRGFRSEILQRNRFQIYRRFTSLAYRPCRDATRPSRPRACRLAGRTPADGGLR